MCLLAVHSAEQRVEGSASCEGSATSWRSRNRYYGLRRGSGAEPADEIVDGLDGNAGGPTNVDDLELAT